jgi:hypothetical protein
LDTAQSYIHRFVLFERTGAYSAGLLRTEDGEDPIEPTGAELAVERIRAATRDNIYDKFCIARIVGRFQKELCFILMAEPNSARLKSAQKKLVKSRLALSNQNNNQKRQSFSEINSWSSLLASFLTAIAAIVYFEDCRHVL